MVLDEAIELRPIVHDNSPARHLTVSRQVTLFRYKDDAHNHAAALRRRITKKGYTRTCRVSLKYIQVQGFSAQIFIVTYRVSRIPEQVA